MLIESIQKYDTHRLAHEFCTVELLTLEVKVALLVVSLAGGCHIRQLEFT